MVKLLRTFRDFSGGLSEVANDNMKDNELVAAKNIVPGDGYGIARTYGTNIAYNRINTNGKVVRVIELQAIINSGVELQTLAFTLEDNGKEHIHIWDSATEEWTTMQEGSSDKEIDPIKSWFIFANKLYWLDGVNFWVYDGSSITAATISNAASSSTGFDDFADKIRESVAVVRRGTRWFFAHGADEVIFSEINKPTTFTMTNIINATTADNDYLTALHTFNDGLLIFKKRSVHHLSGWDFAQGSDIQLIQLNVTSGTEWPLTIKTVENAVLYLGVNGIYRLYVPYTTSQIAAKNISEKKISNHLYDEGRLTGARAEVWDNIYYLSVDNITNGATVNREYRYYIEEAAFYGEFTQGAYAYMPALSGEDRLYLGSDNGYILYYDQDSHHYINTNTGAPTTIPIEAKTKGVDVVGTVFQDAKVKKAFLSVKQYEAESSGLTMQIKADYSDASYATTISSIDEVLQAGFTYSMDFDEALIYSEGEFGEARWGWLETVTKEISIGRKCKRLQFIFTGDLAQPLLIYGIGILYKKKKVKGNREGVESAPIVYPEE